MSLSFAAASRTLDWRRAGSSLAVAASLALALQPSALLAQVQMSDPDRPAPKVAPHAPAKKAVSRQSPTDNVSDDLNRREAARAEQAVRAMTAAPPMAAPAVLPGNSRPVDTKSVELSPAVDLMPPTEAALPPRAPIVSASLTADVGAGQQGAVPPQPQFAQAPAPV
ncbi:MAG: hypothetical protein ACXU9B_11280, partial [Reyranella sp.]